jgi:hypothetical protein
VRGDAGADVLPEEPAPTRQKDSPARQIAHAAEPIRGLWTHFRIPPRRRELNRRVERQLGDIPTRLVHPRHAGAGLDRERYSGNGLERLDADRKLRVYPRRSFRFLECGDSSPL